MSTLAEIEDTVAALSRREQEVLLRRLAAKLQSRSRSQGAGESEKKTWPVLPPKVSKSESRRVLQRIEKQFGRIEWENWKK